MGLYEQQIQELLVQVRYGRGKHILFDVGGADGFFAVGSLVNTLFDYVHVFEKEEEMQRAIKEVLITTQAKRNLSSRSGIGGVLSAT